MLCVGLIIMNFLYNFLYMLPIALAILSQSGCVTDREFMQYQKQLEMEVECYKKIEPYFRIIGLRTRLLHLLMNSKVMGLKILK